MDKQDMYHKAIIRHLTGLQDTQETAAAAEQKNKALKQSINAFGPHEYSK